MTTWLHLCSVLMMIFWLQLTVVSEVHSNSLQFRWQNYNQHPFMWDHSLRAVPTEGVPVSLVTYSSGGKILQNWAIWAIRFKLCIRWLQWRKNWTKSSQFTGQPLPKLLSKVYLQGHNHTLLLHRVSPMAVFIIFNIMYCIVYFQSISIC